MSLRLLKLSFGWGFFLWAVGYFLGILLFPLVPSTLIGWIIMPMGTILLLWILFRKINLGSLKEYFILALIWTLLAMLLDYFLLVKLFHPADGYYKLDVYLYYLITFSLPLGVYWYQTKIRR